MKREEAVNRFKGIRESFSISIAQSKFYPSKVILDELCDMAIEALSAEQKEEELAKDIARRMATIIENEQDMRVILKNASAEPTDLISREEAIKEIENRIGLAWTESEANYNRGMEMALSIIEALPSASAEKHQLFGETSTNTSTNTSSGDLISRAEAHKVLSELSTEGGKDAKMLFMDAHEWIDAIPSADIPTKCIAQINIDADEVVQKIKGEYEIADRPSGEWIPCSEKLPEDGQAVIICTDDKRFKNHPVGTCTYEHGRFHTNFHDDISMIAWMPLPKPYCPNCGAKMGSDTK